MKQNDYALIIGGSSGMGKEMAKRFLEKGYTVMLISKDEEKLFDTKKSLTRDTNGAVETVAIDLHNETAVDAFIDELKADSRHIKYLLNS